MTLTAAQQAAIAAPEPYCLVIAGPGSGKSAVLLARVRRLIAEGVPPGRIVVLTFTIAASAELAQRFAEGSGVLCTAGHILPSGLSGISPSAPLFSTIHGWLLGLLTRHGRLIGLLGPLSVIDEEEQAALLADVLDETAYRGTLKAVLAEVAKGPQARLNPMTKEQIAAEGFFQRLRSDGILTYDMIEHLGLRLLQTMQAKGVPIEVDHLLFDEAQDGTELEWRILDAAGVPNFFAVGDSDQRIYSWRGSCDEFEERWVSHDGKQNYE